MYDVITDFFMFSFAAVSRSHILSYFLQKDKLSLSNDKFIDDIASKRFFVDIFKPMKKQLKNGKPLES